MCMCANTHVYLRDHDCVAVFVCMYVGVCVCRNVRIQYYTCLCTCLCMLCVCIRVYMSVCMSVCMYVCMYVSMYACALVCFSVCFMVTVQYTIQQHCVYVLCTEVCMYFVHQCLYCIQQQYRFFNPIIDVLFVCVRDG